MFWHRLTHPLAKSRVEVVKDEVGVGLRHRADVWDVMPHHHIVERKIGSGSEGQVAHHQSICRYTKDPQHDYCSDRIGLKWLQYVPILPLGGSILMTIGIFVTSQKISKIPV